MITWRVLLPLCAGRLIVLYRAKHALQTVCPREFARVKCHHVHTEGHMTERIRLIVDGKPTELDADPAEPLLYALRSELGLHNPKFGCGLAQCGACTVHVDGRPTRSCVMPVGAVRGKTITTLAGLGTADTPHPLQTAYIAEQVPQCGYCLSGFIMTAAALLRD